MARRGSSGGNRNPGEEGFEGRDLLIGRPEPPAASGKPDGGSDTSAPQSTTRAADADDDLSRQILARLAEIQTELNSLKTTTESERKAVAALAREVAALRQAVEDARGVLAEAAELVAGRDGEAAAAARVLTEGEAALTAHGDALDRRLDETGQRVETAREVLEKMIQAAEGLAERLGFLSASISREFASRRRRRWMAGLALTAVAMAAFPLGALVQRETFFLTLGDPRHEWNAYFVEHYAQRLSACASEAWAISKRIRCGLVVGPSLPVPVTVYPGIRPGVPPAEASADSSAKR